jgi:uncharacterized membrane protein
MRKVRLLYPLFLVVLVAMFMGGGPVGIVVAAERGLLLAATHTSIAIEKDQEVNLEIVVSNTGEVDEFLEIGISSMPEGWEARLLNKAFGTVYGVHGLYLPAGELRMLNFRTKPPSGATSGRYEFILKAKTDDGVVEESLKVNIEVVEMVAAPETVNLTTLYPVLQGPSGSSFEFTVELNNKGSEDRSFNLSAIAPPKWEVSFSPPYEQKQISTIGLKTGENRGVKVNFSPPEDTPAGDYAVVVEASSEDMKGQIDLTVIVTGTYELTLNTPTGRLDAEATAGREGHLSILALNTGSADLRNINFLSNKPEGWIITFSPDRIDSLTGGELREVDVAIKPAAKTIAGDYSITLAASGDRDSDNIRIRVRVGTATTWGWIGLGIVLAVIAGMGVIFWRLGRR